MKIIKSYWLCASANKWSLKQWKHLNWNDCSVQASGTKSEAVEKRSIDSPSYPFLYRHITFYRIQCTQDGMKIVLLFFIRKKDAGLCHVSHQLSPQFIFNLMNPIIFVCLPWGCLPPQRKSGNVLFCILHTCSIRTRALWILISHFVISRYPGGEVCALECEASVCLDVTRASAGDLHFSISGENSGTWLCWIWLMKLSLHCGSDQLCKRMLTFFTEGRCQAGGHRRLNALL